MQCVALSLARFGEWAQRVVPEPFGPFARFCMAHQQHGRRLGGQLLECVEHAHIVRITQLPARLVGTQPTQFVHFVVRGECPVAGTGREVVDHLHRAAAAGFRHRIVHLSEELGQHAGKAGLLGDLPDGRVRGQLAAVEFALRQRPVVVAGPVHNGQFGPLCARAPQHGAGRPDRAGRRRGLHFVDSTGHRLVLGHAHLPQDTFAPCRRSIST